MAKELAKTQKTGLIAKMAADHGVAASDFYETVTQTVFKGANKAQLMTLLMVADRYKLDVTTKELYAFPDKGGGIVPVVSIDGWISLAHKHPAYDGEEMRWAEKRIVPEGGKACPEWCEIVVYRKDTSHPTVIREYLDEVYRKTGPWQSHTKRMLRHKTMIQGYRVAFGFSGIYDEDEAQRISVEQPTLAPVPAAASNAERARRVLASSPSPDADAPPAEPEVVEVEEVSETIEVNYDDIEVDEVTGEVLEEEEPEPAPKPRRRRPPKDDFESAVEAAKKTLDAVEVTAEEEAEAPAAQPITAKQREALKAAKERGGWSNVLFMRLLKEQYHVAKPADLTRDQALDMIKTLLAGSPEADEVQEGLEL